jgi:hypothetical protein
MTVKAFAGRDCYDLVKMLHNTSVWEPTLDSVRYWLRSIVTTKLNASVYLRAY